MNLYEAIFVRKSVRSYTGEAINPQTLDKLKSRFRELTGLFGELRRIWLFWTTGRDSSGC